MLCVLCREERGVGSGFWFMVVGSYTVALTPDACTRMHTMHTRAPSTQINTHRRTQPHTNKHTSTNISIHTHKRTRIHTHTNSHTHTHARARVRRICFSWWICTCVRVGSCPPSQRGARRHRGASARCCCIVSYIYIYIILYCIILDVHASNTHTHTHKHKQQITQTNDNNHTQRIDKLDHTK